MSKSSTASTPKNPTPPPANALGQGIPIKDGVSNPQNNVGAVKQGSPVTFGSIDDVSAPIFSSPTAVPPTTSQGVKTFGSVPVATGQGHVNGEPSTVLGPSIVPPTASTSYTNGNHFTARLIDKILNIWYQNGETASTPILPTHFRRPTTLSLGIPIKDGRNNLDTIKQAMTFGSIDDVFVPIPSSAAAAPPTKSEGVKSFGSMSIATATGHVSRKPFISSRASVVPPTTSTSTAASSVLSAAAPPVKHEIDIKKMFQSPSLAPSSNPPTDTSSPSMRSVGLLTQQQQPHQEQSSHTPPNSLQPAQSFTTFVPSNTMRSSQSNGPNGGPPRSAQYIRQMSNGNGPRSQGSQDGGPSAGLTSPRLESHPHNPQTSAILPPSPPQMQPQIQPQIQPMWYYKYPPSNPTEDHRKNWLAKQEQNDGLKGEAADNEMKEKEKAEAERKAEEMSNLAARLEKTEKELRRKQEEERLRKEAEALKLQRLKEGEEWRLKFKQEEEHILKLAEQKKKALRLAQERTKEERERKEKGEQEKERLSNMAEETRRHLEKEAAKAEAISNPEPSHSPCDTQVRLSLLVKQDGRLEDGKDVDTETSTKSMEGGKYKPKVRIPINTASIDSPTSNKRPPGPLVLTSAIRSASPVVAAPATARVITDVATLSYPEGYHSPHPDLNKNVKNGKFRYDHESLSLNATGLKPVDRTQTMSRGGSSHHRPSSGVLPSRQASVGLGFTPSALGKSGTNNLFSMGNFATSDLPSTLQRTASRGSTHAPEKHVRSKRGENGNENNRVPGGSEGQDRGSGSQSSTMQRTIGEDGADAPLLEKHVRSKRGENGNESNRVPGGLGGQSQGSSNWASITMQRSTGQGGADAPLLEKHVRSKRGENGNESNRVPGGLGGQSKGSSNRPSTMQRTTGQDGDGAPLQKHLRQMQPQMHQPSDIVEKSMTIHLAEDPATTSRNRAIRLVQEQEDGLTTDQKVAMISFFMEDVVAAETYILLTDPEVRQGWILMMLMK